jgi:uncharacterized protein YfaP (DUF2135 family)
LQTLHLKLDSKAGTQGRFQLRYNAVAGSYELRFSYKDQAYSSAFRLAEYFKPHFEIQIKAAAKSADPGRLIVNGVSMPLKIDPAGRFDRPFSFPNGSNSVEVRSPDGQQRHRTQFLNASGGATPAKLRVLLAWDSDNTDLDLHMITPDGGHIWYGDRVVANGAALDVDVTTGYGPEIFAMPAPIKGQYLVYVNYFGGGYRSDEEGQEDAVQQLTTAQVTVITEEGTPSEKMETFLVPMRAVGELTLVKGFSYP